jgi:hypothetical protein
MRVSYYLRHFAAGHDIYNRILWNKVNERVKQPWLCMVFMLLLHMPATITTAAESSLHLNCNCNAELPVGPSLVNYKIYH